MTEAENFNRITAEEGRAIIQRLASSEFYRRIIEENTSQLKRYTEEPMANDEIVVQPDDAKVEVSAATKKSSKADRLAAENKALKATIERVRKAFPNNGHLQKLLRD